jgi:hypothetical protein
MAAPTKPITAVIVSNIANVPLRPARGANDVHAYTVKKIPRRRLYSAAIEVFAQQVCQNRARSHSGLAANRFANVKSAPLAFAVRTVSALQPLGNQREGLPISAAFTMRYLFRD